MEFVFVIVGALIFWWGFNYVMGYRKDSIAMTFDERFYDTKRHVHAIEAKLRQEGRNVRYLGNHEFEVDGKRYAFLERTVSMGDVPMQQTVLKRMK